jgi:hypothetical protein
LLGSWSTYTTPCGIALAFRWRNVPSPYPSEALSMIPDSQTTSQGSHRPAFDSYFWGDSITLKILLGATVLMWALGILNLVVRFFTH